MTKKATKKTTKKVPAKKTTKTKRATKKEGPISEAEVITGMHDSFQAIQASKTRRNLAVKTLADIQRDFFFVNNIYWQWMTGCCGIPKEAFVEIYGPTGIGKTSYVMWLLGHIVGGNSSLTLYISTEPKPMPASRARRFFSPSFSRAQKLLEQVTFMPAHSLAEVEDVVDTWISVARGEHAKSSVKLDKNAKPLVIIIDTLSMLLPPGEAAGFYDWGRNMYEDNKKKRKAVGEGSNLEFAKFMAGWTRRLATKMTTHGVTLILVHHPNDHIDMNAQKGKAHFGQHKTALQVELENTKSIGGRASKRLAAIQYMMSSSGQLVRDPFTKNITGKLVIMGVNKNSDGPTTRSIMFELREEHADRPAEDYQDMGLHLEEKMAAWMVDRGLLGTKGEKGLYSCPKLGLDQVPASVLADALHANQEVLQQLGSYLGITGYVDPAGSLPVTEMSARLQEEAKEAPEEELDPEDAAEAQEEEDESETQEEEDEA